MIQAPGLLTSSFPYQLWHSSYSLSRHAQHSYSLSSSMTYSWQCTSLQKMQVMNFFTENYVINILCFLRLMKPFFLLTIVYLLANLKHSCADSKLTYGHFQNSFGKWNIQSEDDDKWDGNDTEVVLDVQTLTNFPAKKLDGEFVFLRFDSSLLLEPLDIPNVLGDRSLSTIRYLYNAGAKVLLVSNWGKSNDSILLSAESFAGYLSSLLQIKVVTADGVSCPIQTNSKKADILLFENLTHFGEELANCPVFCAKLASGANIFVNDAFFVSHKILSSTVGAARFCYACLAGFHFEEQLRQLKNISTITKRPYLVIIGGGRFREKAAALSLLASNCDGLIFVGMLAFQVMHALGFPVPSNFLEHGALAGVSELIELANSRETAIYFPTDLWCVNDDDPKLFEVFSSKKILPGWTPIDLGPMALKEIYNFLFKCKKVLWIGPVNFASSASDTVGASELACMLERLVRCGCDITVVGNAACQAVLESNSSLPQLKLFRNASVVWDFLKGKILPGVAALDRAYPYKINWVNIYEDSSQPLVVDIGSVSLNVEWSVDVFLELQGVLTENEREEFSFH